MRNVLFSTVALAAMTTAVIAEQDPAVMPYGPILSGEVALDFAETDAGDIAGDMTIELGIDAVGLATVDLDLGMDEDGNASLDDWTVGTTVGAAELAFGTDNGLMPGAEGEQTLAAPAMTESLAISVGPAALALGFADWNTDITDISNIQGAYALGVAGLNVTAAADYNLDSENTVLGAEVGGIELAGVGLGGAMTYDVDAESFGYETVASAYGITAYLNGDDTDVLQNIGGEYEMPVGGAMLTAGANYNIDNEDFAPTAGLVFNF